MDAPQQYMSEFFEKIPEQHLKPIRNSELLLVDTYSYLPTWEISPSEATRIMHSGSPKAPIIIIDIRETADSFSHPFRPPRKLGPRSIQILNLDIGTQAHHPNPYLHPPTMVSQWRALDQHLHNPVDPTFGDDQLAGKVVICICYKGGTSRAAVPILRHRGIEAYNIVGGLVAWEEAGTIQSSHEIPLARL